MASIVIEEGIAVKIVLDGNGKTEIKTKDKNFDRLLEIFAKSGYFDLVVDNKSRKATIADVGLALGKAVRQAVDRLDYYTGEGYFTTPIEFSLGIFYLNLRTAPSIGFDVEFSDKRSEGLARFTHSFFDSFTKGSESTIRIRFPYGSDKDKLDSIFKSFGKALSIACSSNPDAKQAMLDKRIL